MDGKEFAEKQFTLKVTNYLSAQERIQQRPCSYNNLYVKGLKKDISHEEFDVLTMPDPTFRNSSLSMVRFSAASS